MGDTGFSAGVTMPVLFHLLTMWFRECVVLCELHAGGGKVRRRNSMASLGRLLDSQSSGEHDDEEVDSVIGSRPSSFNRGPDRGPDRRPSTVVQTLVQTAVLQPWSRPWSRPSSFNRGRRAGSKLTFKAIVNANGSVPRAAGIDNNAFDAGAAESVEEKRSELDQTSEKRDVEMVTAEVSDKEGVGNVPAGRGHAHHHHHYHHHHHHLSKKVSFVGFSEEPERNKENSTESSQIKMQTFNSSDNS